jgi:radical SAM protein with 4Fe4S-binding SPASM domain
LSEHKRGKVSRLPEVRFDVVILKENHAEIPDIIRLARDLGVGVVYFRAVQTKGIGKEREEAIGKDVDFDSLRRVVRQGIADAARLGIRTNLRDIDRDFDSYHSIYQKQDAAMSDQVCLLPWLQCFISVRGELSPCCATYTNESFSAGNVFEQDFETVWNGPKMQSIRRQFRSRRNPLAVCRDCIPHSLPVLLKMSGMLPGFVFRAVRR